MTINNDLRADTLQQAKRKRTFTQMHFNRGIELAIEAMAADTDLASIDPREAYLLLLSVISSTILDNTTRGNVENYFKRQKKIHTLPENAQATVELAVKETIEALIQNLSTRPELAEASEADIVEVVVKQFRNYTGSESKDTLRKRLRQLR